MGFEVHFKYYKKKTEGIGYETEGEPEVMKVAVGKQWDEIDLDEVAKAIFGQMAKRNILIVDAEVFEFTKKKVSFKMKDDGISIKNRKFSYDITGAVKSENEVDDAIMTSVPVEAVINTSGMEPHEVMRRRPMPQTAIVPATPQQTDLSHLPPEVQAEIRQQQIVQQQQPAYPAERMRPVLPPQGQPLRYERYEPHPDLARIAQQKKLPFTLNKRYPIYEEKPDRRGVQYGMLYVTQDDNGNRQILNDKHFVPETRLSNNFDSDTRPNYIPRVAVEENQIAVGGGKVMNLPDIYTLGNRRR